MSVINESTGDRTVRVLLGIVLLTLGWTGIVGATAGLVLKIVGFLPLVTGVVGWCPAYSLLRISTNKPRRPV